MIHYPSDLRHLLFSVSALSGEPLGTLPSTALTGTGHTRLGDGSDSRLTSKYQSNHLLGSGGLGQRVQYMHIANAVVR